MLEALQALSTAPAMTERRPPLFIGFEEQDCNSMTVLVYDDACKNVGWCELTLSTEVDIYTYYEGQNEQGATQAPTCD
jgi:hypothetical protein